MAGLRRRVRRQFLLKGRMPITEDLPYSWYDTPNIHFCTVRDFVTLVDEIEAKIEKAVALRGNGRVMNGAVRLGIWNALADQAIFLLSRR
jgi:methionine biosynthesis protein MetW